jgi:hypothetical protein
MKAESLDDYAVKSEAPGPAPVENPHTEYYGSAKARELFRGFPLLEEWTTHRDLLRAGIVLKEQVNSDNGRRYGNQRD